MMPLKRSFKYYVLFWLLLLFVSTSCGPSYKAAKARRATEKNMEQRRVEGEKALAEGKKQHLERQTPETRRRMSQTRRQSERLNIRKMPFYKRWYYRIIKR